MWHHGSRVVNLASNSPFIPLSHTHTHTASVQRLNSNSGILPAKLRTASASWRGGGMFNATCCNNATHSVCSQVATVAWCSLMERCQATPSWQSHRHWQSRWQSLCSTRAESPALAEPLAEPLAESQAPRWRRARAAAASPVLRTHVIWIPYVCMRWQPRS